MADRPAPKPSAPRPAPGATSPPPSSSPHTDEEEGTTRSHGTAARYGEQISATADDAGIIWQLAVWVCSPAPDDATQALRVAQCRQLLLSLVDQLAPEAGAGELHMRESRSPDRH